MLTGNDVGSDSFSGFPLKKCSGPCKRLLPATSQFFNRDKSRKDGLTYVCIECRHQQKAMNKDKVAEINKTYYEKNKEIIKQQKRQDYNDNKEKYSIRSRKYRKKNREKLLEYDRRYYEENKEIYLMRLNVYRKTPKGRLVDKIAHHKRRALKRNTGGSYTVRQIQQQLERQKNQCYYCHKRFKKKNNNYIFHIEHIVPLSRGGSNTIDNIVLACPHCNTSKYNKLPHEWLKGGRLL